MIETTGYGALRDLQGLGDFRIEKPLKILQNQDLAVVVGKGVECCPKDQACLAPLMKTGRVSRRPGRADLDLLVTHLVTGGFG